MPERCDGNKLLENGCQSDFSFLLRGRETEKLHLPKWRLNGRGNNGRTEAKLDSFFNCFEWK